MSDLMLHGALNIKVTRTQQYNRTCSDDQGLRSLDDNSFCCKALQSKKLIIRLRSKLLDGKLFFCFHELRCTGNRRHENG